MTQKSKQKEKTAALFNPYLDTLGGGERYFLTLASVLANKSWHVDIFWPSYRISKKAEHRFGINLKRVNFLNTDISQINLFKRYKILSQYDLSFFVSDGSVPFLFAKKNLLHFQVPFHGLHRHKLIEELKFKRIDAVVCNSCFTKKYIDEQFHLDSSVIYPPVDTNRFKPGKKENIILSVARFTDLLHNKRQDVLVESFKKIFPAKNSAWRLVLAGGDEEGKLLVKKLKKLSADNQVVFSTSPSFTQLRELYARAKIFWSASGFGIDEKKHPERVEHFGMTTAESMAAGCVPVVIDKGGQKEIVEIGRCGYLWQNEKELVKLTKKLIDKPRIWEDFSENAIKRSRLFSEANFRQSYEKIIGEC